MKILTIADYDNLEKVNARDLQRLIDEGKIICFRRSSGWVKVYTDPIRGTGGDYPGPERREIRQNPPTGFDIGLHFCPLRDNS